MRRSFPIFLAETLTKGEAFFVEALKLGDVFLYAVYLHGALGTDADDTALVFHALHIFELCVVGGKTTAEDYTQTGIFAIDETRNLHVLACVAITAVAGEHQHVGGMPHVDGVLQGYAVNNASIEHGDAVDIDDLADIRQAARCTHDVEGPLAVMALGEIHGLARETVGRDHLEGHGRAEEGVEIERKILIGKLVVKQLTVEDAPLGDKVAQAYIFVTGQIVDIGDACPAWLWLT